MRGGNTRHTRNLRVKHDNPIHTLTGSYSAESYWQDLLKVTQGKTDERLAKLMINASEALIDWLHERQVHFQPALRGTLNLSHSNAFFLGGGKSLLNSLYRYAQDLDVNVHYQTEVTDLHINNGTFQSANLLYDNKNQQISAHSVVVASGGFQADIDWLTQAWGEAAQNFLIRGTPFNTGTMLKSLMRAEAQTVSDPTQCHAIAIDARSPKFDGGIVTRLDCVCFSIVVNNHAQRFYDEGEDFWPKRYAIWGRLIAQQPEQIAYAIVDDKVVNKYMPSVYPPITANTIEALAAKLELDPQQLCQTIDDFNNAVQPGHYNHQVLDNCTTDHINPPKSHWALKINQPPYYAYPLRPGITFTYLGVKVDQQSRVLFPNKPSPNIFAAGEIMAGNILGQGYCAGTGMTIGGVFGRIAGQQAAAHAATQNQ